MDNIKSAYVIKNIVNYIKDENIKVKIFLYSKKYQKILDINLIEFKEKYLLNEIEFDLDEYLQFSIFEPYEKDYLLNKYNDFFKEKNINKERIECIIYDIFENKKIKNIDEEDLDELENYEKKIYIESQLFKLTPKTKNFEKIFTIIIPQKNIEENNLKDFYTNTFNDLNKLNIKYSSTTFISNDSNKLNYLKEINIDFNKIKRMTILIEVEQYSYFNEDVIDKFFENLFKIIK